MEAATPAAEKNASTTESNLIKIKVKTLGQASYDLEVQSDALIKDVKTQLAQASNVPANHQRLVFRGRVLKDNQRLSNYNVVDASVVHMVTRPVDTSQQPPQPSQRERVPHAGAGQFTANMMGGQFGVPMDMNDFGSFIANMLHTMGIQGAVHVTHTTMPSDTAGVASPEQMAQAVAEQFSQQARQQSAEAGGEAPIPLLSAIRNYMQRLNAMYQGDASARFLNLPPIATGGSTTFNVHQYAAAAREFIGEWEGAEEVSNFIASSAEPSFGHWQPEGDPNAAPQTPTAAPATATQGGATEGQHAGSEQPSSAVPPTASAETRAQLAQVAAAAAAVAAAQGMNEAVQATESAEAEAAAAAQRDPRRNGMDNPFGEGRPEPMHPSLARLTGIAMHQLLRETARHLQAQAIPRIIQNRVDLQGPLQQQRLFSDEELDGLAQTLHAEGTLLLETARAVSAYLLAQRSDSAGPLLNATAYHLRPDGSAPANTVPAALSSRRLTQERRNAIFINGRPDAGSPAAGAGQAAGVNGRPPRQTARRGRGFATGGRGDGSTQQSPSSVSGVPLGMPIQVLRAVQGIVSGGAQIPIGGHMLRMNQDQENSVAVQLDDGQPVVVNLAPVAQAVENVFSSVPGLEDLLAHLFPAAASGAPAAPASEGVSTAAQGGSGAPATAASPADSSAPGVTPSSAATSATSAQAATSAALPGIMQQVLPFVMSMLAASGQVAAQGSAGPTVEIDDNPQRGTQAGQRFAMPQFLMGPDNEMMVDIQALMQGGTAAAQEAMGPILDGIMFSMMQGGAPPPLVHPPHGGPPRVRRPGQQTAPGGPLGLRTPEQRAAYEAREREYARSHGEDDDDDSDDDVPGLIRDSDQAPSLDSDSDELDSQEDSDMGSDSEEDDDESGSGDDDDDDDDWPSDVPGLVDSEDDRSEGWQTAEEDSEAEAEARGGSDHGRRVRSRRESPSPKVEDTAAQDKAAEVTKEKEKQEARMSAPMVTRAAPAASSSIPVPAPGARSGLQSWPLSADNFDDFVSPAASPSTSAPIVPPPQPPRVSAPPVGLGTGLALPPRGGRGRGRGGRSTHAGRGRALERQSGSGTAGGGGTAPQASPTPCPPTMVQDSSAADVEEVPRQAGSRAEPAPNLSELLSTLLSGAGGRGAPAGTARAPAGTAPRSAHGPGSGGLMDILQSPALQQMTNQILRPTPGAPVSEAPVSGAPSGGPAGGLMGMLGQLAQSPAIERMADQLAGQMEGGGGGGGGQGVLSRGPGGRGARGDGAPPDFGSFLQQMLPVMGQMLGGQGEAPVGAAHGRSPGAHAPDSGNEFAALEALPPEEASRWRQIILADRIAQAEQPAAALSSTYLAGSRSARMNE